MQLSLPTATSPFCCDISIALRCRESITWAGMEFSLKENILLGIQLVETLGLKSILHSPKVGFRPHKDALMYQPPIQASGSVGNKRTLCQKPLSAPNGSFIAQIWKYLSFFSSHCFGVQTSSDETTASRGLLCNSHSLVCLAGCSEEPPPCISAPSAGTLEEAGRRCCCI